MTDPTTSTVGRARLIDNLDTLADVAHAIEAAVDTGRPVDDPADLIRRLRGVIADVNFDLEASDFLGDGDGSPPTAIRPSQPILDVGEAVRRLDEDHHHARERLFHRLARRGAAAPTRCGTCGAPLDLDADGSWRHPHPPCVFAADPYLADRHADLAMTLRVDPDGHPLVWADHGDVIVALGDPGAGVAGVRAQLVVPGTAARRWFTDLIAQLGPTLAAADRQRER